MDQPAPDLSGLLAGVSLGTLIQAMRGLRASGRLRMDSAHPDGEVSRSSWLIVAMALGQERAVQAVEALTRAMKEAGFASSATEHAKASPLDTMPPVGIRETELRHGEAARLAVVVLSLLTVPRRIEMAPGEAASGSIVLSRSALRTLLATGGRRTIADIVGNRDTLDVLRDLLALERLGLVDFERPDRMAGASNERHGTSTERSLASRGKPTQWPASRMRALRARAAGRSSGTRLLAGRRRADRRLGIPGTASERPRPTSAGPGRGEEQGAAQRDSNGRGNAAAPAPSRSFRRLPVARALLAAVTVMLLTIPASLPTEGTWLFDLQAATPRPGVSDTELATPDIPPGDPASVAALSTSAASDAATVLARSATVLARSTELAVGPDASSPEPSPSSTTPRPVGAPAP